MNIKKIGVICPYRFPEGMAPTIRIIAYCKGLQEHGVKCEVFSYHDWSAADNVPETGVVQSIKFHNCYYTTSTNPVRRLLVDKVQMLRRLKRQMTKSHKEMSFDVLLFSLDGIVPLFMLMPIARALSAKLGFIGDEFPQPIRDLKPKIPTWMLNGYKIIHRHFSFRVLMTESLQRFYDEKVCPKPTFLMNSIIDEKRFEGIVRQQVAQKYFCYMGNMMLAKDNVDNIIRAFALIADAFPEYQLWLFGMPSPADRRIVEEVIARAELNDRVYIKGRVDYAQVPQILANATLLLTSQPQTVRAQGGFPTKMAEYMMSHTPMIVTNVGEIHKYVHDGVNTFMVEPCNPQEYAEKMKYVLTHPREAGMVADNAYMVALNGYGAKNITKGLMTFLSNLN